MWTTCWTWVKAWGSAAGISTSLAETAKISMSDYSSSGILTFLFTDLEDSTRLWEQFPQAMRPALARHDALLKQAVEAQRGSIVKTTGDGIHAVFESAADAAAAALAAQMAIQKEKWPQETGALRVRMGLHSGESWARAADDLQF